MYNIKKSDIALGTALFCSLLALAYPYLRLWFNMDDTSCIYGATMGLQKLVFDRDSYLLFNKMFYSPMLPAAFIIDFKLFGMDPLGYHIHNLIAAFCVGIMGLHVYRLYLSPAGAWAATFLFTLSYPMVTNIGWITRKHYLWGTFTFLAAFYCFKKFESQHNTLYAVISYVCYFISLLFKEAFAPFPAVVFIMGEGTMKERTIKTIPFVLVFAGYMILRFSLLGGMGGYIGDNHPLAISLLQAGLNYARQFHILISSVWGMTGFLLAFFAVMLFFLDRKSFFILMLLMLIITSPFFLLHVPPAIDSYYLFYLPSKYLLALFILSGGIALTISKVDIKFIRTITLVAAAVLAISQIVHARDAYAYMQSSTGGYNRLTMDLLSKNNEGDNVMVIHPDAIFYNFYYEAYKRDKRQTGKATGGVVSFDNPEIAASFQQAISSFSLGEEDVAKKSSPANPLVYSNGKWGAEWPTVVRAEGRRLAYSVADCSIKKQFLSCMIKDNLPGQYYGVLETALSTSNIAFQSMKMKAGVRMGFGLVPGRESFYLVYCSSGECSAPEEIKVLEE